MVCPLIMRVSDDTYGHAIIDLSPAPSTGEYKVQLKARIGNKELTCAIQLEVMPGLAPASLEWVPVPSSSSSSSSPTFSLHSHEAHHVPVIQAGSSLPDRDLCVCVRAENNTYLDVSEMNLTMKVTGPGRYSSSVVATKDAYDPSLPSSAAPTPRDDASMVVYMFSGSMFNAFTLAGEYHVTVAYNQPQQGESSSSSRPRPHLTLSSSFRVVPSAPAQLAFDHAIVPAMIIERGFIVQQDKPILFKDIHGNRVDELPQELQDSYIVVTAQRRDGDDVVRVDNMVTGSLRVPVGRSPRLGRVNVQDTSFHTADYELIISIENHPAIASLCLPFTYDNGTSSRERAQRLNEAKMKKTVLDEARKTASQELTNLKQIYESKHRETKNAVRNRMLHKNVPGRNVHSKSSTAVTLSTPWSVYVGPAYPSRVCSRNWDISRIHK
eukprot:TRINITY_DN5265_c0_g1_i3.p1 TRINITY_DN5265_c0_g1~~TRINITY_DN5265_c0_g1_i3.p1  ORF type:complete len:438 (-),score=83.89 TRINITY_DN5265_c0_g1_i3:763-2076(-)